ncbi:cation:proton antiporter [Brevibacterium sp. BRM-1]|uniref:cation:proton antiporter n=1 Tax=Brevibacterium sp. BRM-1 TaxID=2999062 RepID=UPI002280AFA8|nr:cation:proton antiporter [Brevibacterium sp. BRM-1]WAL41164.1 cation:proton antiporter [Brevibacterium sp. BRM-1]
MSFILLTGFGAVAAWALVARRFERTGIAGPAALAAVGALVACADVSAFREAAGSEAAERCVELVLAVLLFIDASEVRGGVFGGEGRTVGRLVLIALPLSLVLVVATGWFLLPQVDAFALLAIACVVMPTDFATAAALLRSDRIPARMRRILNVESGYNDGLVSPVFSMAIALSLVAQALDTAGGEAAEVSQQSARLIEQHLEEFGEALIGALPATLVALAVGVSLGAAFGWLARLAHSRGWADASGIRFVALLVPPLAFGIALLPVLESNGFIAAFVAGIAFRLTRSGSAGDAVPPAELLLVDEVGTLAANFVWFALGAMIPIVVADGFDWPIVLIAVLALTVFRMLPVYVSLLRSDIARWDRALLGAVGPRGAATIVFGLLAYTKLPGQLSRDALTAMVFTVVGSMVLHGMLAPVLLRRWRAPGTAATGASADREARPENERRLGGERRAAGEGGAGGAASTGGKASAEGEVRAGGGARARGSRSGGPQAVPRAGGSARPAEPID